MQQTVDRASIKDWHLIPTLNQLRHSRVIKDSQSHFQDPSWSTESTSDQLLTIVACNACHVSCFQTAPRPSYVTATLRVWPCSLCSSSSGAPGSHAHVSQKNRQKRQQLKLKPG